LIFGSAFAGTWQSGADHTWHMMHLWSECRSDAGTAEARQLDDAMQGRLDFLNWS
jgi:hypothetical protein